jgi:hypothetical protein
MSWKFRQGVPGFGEQDLYVCDASVYQLFLFIQPNTIDPEPLG